MYGIACITGAVMLVIAIDGSALAACYPNDKIDDTTSAYAKEKIESAGFEQVRDLRKGCDNYWHGAAKRGSTDVHVVLTPKGKVMIEET